MTTLAADQPATARVASSAPRAINVLRLHLTNKWTTLGTPLLILTFIFAVNYVIWLLIYTSTPEAARTAAGGNQYVEGTQYSGSTFYIFIYMLVIAIQVVLRTFPFALGFSITRRDFYLGTALLFGVLAAIYSVILTIMSYIEEATTGWGLGGHMFSTVWFGTGSLGQRLSSEFFAFLFFFFVGAAISTVYLRWRATGMIVLWGSIVLIGVAAAALITFANGWPAVGTWFLNAGVYGVVLWSLVITVISAFFGFRILRRATPVN
ncbi:ABC transporter permease [Subtercola lobariae]|uniref:Uncharacterized protein n=1 Tax=Subtercola lobariae TaxID=1588641 RepID=A0A917ESX9_9MICO|nr:ABC transporter permease [Subtercola lobariae]GGF11276.1 hypothetical protein GCM10011399_01350 [Subtercola lobariae]